MFTRHEKLMFAHKEDNMLGSNKGNQLFMEDLNEVTE